MHWGGVICLALLPTFQALLVQDGASKNRRAVQGQHVLRGMTSLERHRCQSMGEEVCSQNNVSVLESQNEDGSWTRSLRFGQECAVESAVVCKKRKPCGSVCGVDCPCDVDVSGDLPEPYMQTMFDQLSPICKQDTSRVLLLGLGGGELAQYILHHCQGMHVDSVELNADVIAFGRAYFGLHEAEKQYPDRLTIEHTDALSAVTERVRRNPGVYDAILVDCFAGAGEVPQSCRSEEFAQRVKSALKLEGKLIQNIWHFSRETPAVAEEFTATKSTYRKVFDGALDDFLVPMPPHIQWVNILKATRREQQLEDSDGLDSA